MDQETEGTRLGWVGLGWVGLGWLNWRERDFQVKKVHVGRSKRMACQQRTRFIWHPFVVVVDIERDESHL